MMITLEGLKFLAQRARDDFEVGAVSRQLLRRLYLDYNREIEDIDGFLDRAARLFPKGNCGLASVYLRHVLGIGEVVKGRYYGKPHTFLLVDVRILDITADQFGGPSVYIGDFTQPWSVG